ncbi:hypothetical protein [Mycobacteroides abscessus]|uniref:hypothetical protein n=2 Tax=Mycobacteroides abscessus TaxID=36809 RepID=UPI00092ADE80|nr:Bacteriophage protein [Mycobacteroides abscessus subsp. bolletii]SII70584.1 Bacteriophage protein [Mycobacteroides abscessus subsp. bolletii]SKS57883.1 Bacteriophage protein [Mycobacteroides abscessus subsp. bolletii]SKT02378.1 Bacteriophage protein [Mycobacteroides abscessus subsp. bolletii]SLD19303.1 Bacteriophage protein [Mycobacteroides abscessus subsp. bolletii]
MASSAALADTGMAGAVPAAWSDSDDIDELEPYDDFGRRNWLISGIVFGATAAVACLAAGGAYVFLREGPHETPAIGSPIPPSSVIAPKVTAPPPAPPTPPVTTVSPAPIALPAPDGSVFVGTKSGKTSCQVTPGRVGCLVRFSISTPIMYGMPANGVEITAGGDFNWMIGDRGQVQYKTLSYGTVYRTLGWTITPTTEGTKFINDATAHGMTVSVEAVTPF